MMTGILLSIFIFLFLSIIALVIYNSWKQFKDLRPGDCCGKFMDCGATSDIILQEIIKVDVDDKGYTTKIYTKDNAYTFLGFIKNSIMAVYD